MKLEQAARQALHLMKHIGIDHVGLREALAEQAEQEPVAWWFQPPNKNVRPMFDTQQHGGKWQPLYAAPVRTKDLTPHEITALIREGAADGGWQGFAQRVIAADREKNHG